MKLSIGTKIPIQSYKHHEQLHRVWLKTTVLEVKDKLLVTGHHATKVLECNGRSWYTKEPAICFFYEDLWFNVIAMIRKDGLYFYCNLSSPFLYDGEAIKYIDYDLDVKVFPDGHYAILDRNEYEYHSKIMNYPEEVKKIIEDQLSVLIEKIKKQESPFDKQVVFKYYDMYLKVTQNKKEKKK